MERRSTRAVRSRGRRTSPTRPTPSTAGAPTSASPLRATTRRSPRAALLASSVSISASSRSSGLLRPLRRPLLRADRRLRLREDLRLERTDHVRVALVVLRQHAMELVVVVLRHARLLG